LSLSSSLVDEIDQYMKRLFPITRSITGPGNRETLNILKELIPLDILEYRSGSKVYDWEIPDEWSVRDAWIMDTEGNKLVDFQVCNVHLVSYSEPIHRSMGFDELKQHLHIHPDLKDAIPYRTTYYKRDWGFCLTHDQYESLQKNEGQFEVYIDSDFNPNGSLSVGELVIPGKSDHEILISTYICHPSLANDNLSGAVMTAFLAKELLQQSNLTKSYRFIWIPETIGAIAYCANNEQKMKSIQTGLVVTTVGGQGSFGYKQSYNVNHSVNVAIEQVFKEEGIDWIEYPFDIFGSDERQYSTQGYRINVASITKDKYYEYPYYHTSLDNLDYVQPENIAQSLMLHLKVVDKLDEEPIYKNKVESCEVMLSKHDLYPKVGGGQLPSVDRELTELDLIMWLLWLCDGEKGVFEVSQIIGVECELLMPVINRLISKQVLEQVV